MLLRVEIVVTEAKVDDDMDPAGAIRKAILIPTHVAGLNLRLMRESSFLVLGPIGPFFLLVFSFGGEARTDWSLVCPSSQGPNGPFPFWRDQ
jgi:hypothetical protein